VARLSYPHSPICHVPLQNKQFAEELKGLYKWIAEVNDFRKDQEPAAGDPETLEAQLDQSEVCMVFLWYIYKTEDWELLSLSGGPFDVAPLFSVKLRTGCQRDSGVEEEMGGKW